MRNCYDAGFHLCRAKDVTITLNGSIKYIFTIKTDNSIINITCHDKYYHNI